MVMQISWDKDRFCENEKKCIFELSQESKIEWSWLFDGNLMNDWNIIIFIEGEMLVDPRPYTY